MRRSSVMSSSRPVKLKPAGTLRNADLLGVFHRELHDGAHLVVVHVVDDRGYQHDFDSGFVHVLDRAGA
jgi:predicted Ser/Thr protein kinase